MAQILVVDDEAYIRDVVRRLMTVAGHQVIGAGNGVEGLEKARRLAPDLDLILLDLVMPDMDGIEVCRRLRVTPELKTTPVVFLTVFGTLDGKLEAFAAGADDFIVKPFEPAELEKRVAAVLRRTQRRLRVGDLNLDLRTRRVRLDGKEVFLTPVEFALLEHLMRSAGEVFSARRLLEEVWGYPSGVGNPTLVQVHIHNLRRKLGAHRIVTVRRYGYYISPAPSPPE